MCGALRGEQRVTHRLAAAGELFLKLRLVVDLVGERELDRAVECGHDRPLDSGEAVLEVDRGHRRLEHRSEDVAVDGEPGGLARLRVRMAGEKLLAEPELLGDHRAARPRDDLRAELGHLPFLEVREALVQRVRDRELEHGVAEELEPFV